MLHTHLLTIVLAFGPHETSLTGVFLFIAIVAGGYRLVYRQKNPRRPRR